MSDCVCRVGDPCVFHASQSAPKEHNVSEFLGSKTPEKNEDDLDEADMGMLREQKRLKG